MKPIHLLKSVLLLGTIAAVSPLQGFQLGIKQCLEVGGGTSSGGRFTLCGSVGQGTATPPITGGQFKLEPGFWTGLTAQQTPGAPELKLRLLPGGQALLHWPVDVKGFVLEETTDLSSGVWNQVSQPVVDTATQHNVTVPAAGLIKIYRLKSQ